MNGATYYDRNRDSNWLAARGWEVVAVEPSALRDRAARDSHQRVVWMNDALPDLRTLRALGRRFDLILLSAVWMHVAPKGRERAFRILSELLGPSGLLVITLRLGGDAAENAARGFHDTSAEELIGYANRRAIALRSRTTQPDLRRPGLKWETLVFAMPDDGTGSLPLLRHVIVNDNKSSTYKLGLLRTLVRLAETAPGLIIERTDDLRGHSIRGRRPVLVETVLAPGVAPPPAAAPIGAGRLWLGEGSVPPTAGRLAFRPSARRPVRCGSGRHPHPRHQRRLRQYREDAGALHHSSGFRQSAVVRVGVFPGTGNRPTLRAVTPIPGAVRPLPDSRAVMAGARPVRLLAGSGHRSGVAAVDGELERHREPAHVVYATAKMAGSNISLRSNSRRILRLVGIQALYRRPNSARIKSPARSPVAFESCPPELALRPALRRPRWVSNATSAASAKASANASASGWFSATTPAT